MVSLLHLPYDAPSQTSPAKMVSWYFVHFSQIISNSVEVILVQNAEQVRGENYTTKYYGRWKLSCLALLACSTIPVTSQTQSVTLLSVNHWLLKLCIFPHKIQRGHGLPAFPAVNCGQQF